MWPFSTETVSFVFNLRVLSKRPPQIMTKMFFFQHLLWRIKQNRSRRSVFNFWVGLLMCLTAHDTPAKLCYWVAGQHRFKQHGRRWFMTICSHSSVALSNIFLPGTKFLCTNHIKEGHHPPTCTHTHKNVSDRLEAKL